MTQSSTSTYALEGLTPKRVERPDSIEALSAVLRDAHRAGESVVPWGGGTRMHVGNFPGAFDVAVDMTRLNRVIEHEPADMTVIAEAGISVGTLSSTLAKEGQRLAFDPAYPRRSTLGGGLASNAVGPLSSGFGGIRDWTIGLHVVEADGTVTKSGGKVVKNVQGFDLVRLHIGAFGTLGVIARAAFKLLPVPAASKTIAAWFADLPSARDAAVQIFNGPFVPECCSVMSGPRANAWVDQLGPSAQPATDGYVLLLVRVAGGRATVEREENEATGLVGAALASGYAVLDESDAESLWAEVRGETASPPVASVRCGFKPTDAFAFVEHLGRRSSNRETPSAVIHVGMGTVLASYGTWESSAVDVKNWLEHTLQLAASFSVTPVAERCPLSIKRGLDVWGEVGATLAIMKRLKEQFDPTRVLNPGRFAAGI